MIILRKKLRSAGHAVERIVRQRLRMYEAESKLIQDAQRYWDAASEQKSHGGSSHWRGNGAFADRDDRWLALGANNLRIFERMAGPERLTQRASRIVDWGCGGGANAIYFGRQAAQYYGVDITAASLEECQRQMEAEGLRSFVPVLIEAASPEAARRSIAEPCDLVLSTYVFELIPSKSYGERVLRCIASLLEKDGLAFIQIKYSDATSTSLSRRWNYAANMADMTTYRVEEFWLLASACGLEPLQVVLEPEQALVQDRRYAYYLLRRA